MSAAWGPPTAPPAEGAAAALTVERLNYSPHGESGALFYMLGAISELGRVGMVAIGNSREEADAVYARAVATLDRMCGAG
jgi:hypothetical protein